MEAVKDSPNIITKEELPPNVVIVERPEAKYRIIYGFHQIPQKTEDMGNTDALVLEWNTGNYSTGDKAEETFDKLANYKQYQNLVGHLQQREKPIFLADIGDTDIHDILRFSLQVLEPTVGLLLIINLAKGLKKQGVARREFLKSGAKGLAVFYFLSSLPGLISTNLQDRNINEHSASRAVNKFLTDLDEKMHPETEAIALTLRNHLFAQKLTTIAGMMTPYMEGRPEVGIVIGARHHGIESALQKEDRERVELIDRLLRIPGLEEVREKIATIARLDFDKNQGKWVATITKDPHLAPLEQKR